MKAVIKEIQRSSHIGYGKDVPKQNQSIRTNRMIENIQLPAWLPLFLTVALHC